jgi:drug/metabolite transporter (DMT)-like permease
MIAGGNAWFALAAAALWGGGDFSGGMGVKRAGGTVNAAVRFVLLSHAASFTVLLTIATLRGDPFPRGAFLAWALAAGLAVGLSITCFYIALARSTPEHPMGVAAAISGLLAAAIPTAIALWADGSPGPRRLAGFAVAALAIWLIAAAPTASPNWTTTALALTAGVGFGLYFFALKMAGPAGIVWPMAVARMASIGLCATILLATRLRAAPGPPARIDSIAARWILATALLDTSGNLLFIAATRAGRLDIAAVLGSLYPASTILLAALTLGERPTRRQALGMATAVIAVVLIAL